VEWPDRCRTIANKVKNTGLDIISQSKVGFALLKIKEGILDLVSLPPNSN